MKIDLFKDNKLTNNIFDHIKLDNLIMFSYAEAGANGIPGNIEAVVIIDDNIKIFRGSYIMNKEELSKETANKFINYVWKNEKIDDNWVVLNMGLGNCLFIKKDYSKEFIDRYTELIDKLPYILFETWKDYATYVLNKHFNNKEDELYLKRAEEQISIICSQFDIVPNNKVNFNLYHKFVKVNCKNGPTISGVFTDDFEDEKEIVVNGTIIKYDEIESMELYFSPIERHLLLVLNEEDIFFMRYIGINTSTTDILDIYNQLEDYLQTHGMEDNDLNDDGIHCEEILDKISKLDSLDKKELYTYVSVVYDDDIVAKTIGEPSFYYKTDIEDISVGDKVLVDRQGKEVVGEIIDIEYRTEDDLPFPLDKTKDIIKIINDK